MSERRKRGLGSMRLMSTWGDIWRNFMGCISKSLLALSRQRTLSAALLKDDCTLSKPSKCRSDVQFRSGPVTGYTSAFSPTRYRTTQKRIMVD